MLTDAMKFFLNNFFPFSCLFLKFGNHTKRTIYLSNPFRDVSLVEWQKVLNHFGVDEREALKGIALLWKEISRGTKKING